MVHLRGQGKELDENVDEVAPAWPKGRDSLPERHLSWRELSYYEGAKEAIHLFRNGQDNDWRKPPRIEGRPSPQSADWRCE